MKFTVYFKNDFRKGHLVAMHKKNLELLKEGLKDRGYQIILVVAK